MDLMRLLHYLNSHHYIKSKAPFAPVNLSIYLMSINKVFIYQKIVILLKNVEKFYNFKRDGDVQKGDVSQDYYSEWIETQDQYYLDEMKDTTSKIVVLL